MWNLLPVRLGLLFTSILVSAQAFAIPDSFLDECRAQMTGTLIPRYLFSIGVQNIDDCEVVNHTIKTIDYIEVAFSGTKDVSFVKYFPNLQHLVLSGNAISLTAAVYPLSGSGSFVEPAPSTEQKSR